MVSIEKALFLAFVFFAIFVGSGSAGLLTFLTNEHKVYYPADVNGGDANFGNLWAVNIDANSIAVDYYLARNWIDANYLHDLNLFGTLAVAGDIFGGDSVYALNEVWTSFLGSNFVGSLDMTADPWELSGTGLGVAGDLRLDQDLNVLGNAQIRGGLNVWGGLNVAGNATLQFDGTNFSVGNTGTASNGGRILGFTEAFGAATGTMTATGKGSIALGYAAGYDNSAAIQSTGRGSTALGCADTSDNESYIIASGDGSFAGGYTWVDEGNARILATNYGSFAWAFNRPGYTEAYPDATSSGEGSVLMGAVLDADSDLAQMTSSGTGSIALGLANAGVHQATGQAAIAIGENVQANQNNAICFGKNITNNTANSLAIGFGSTELTLNSGDLDISGKLSATGGIDPPYVLYDKLQLEEMLEKINLEVPPAKRQGLAVWWNGEKLFGYQPSTGDLFEVQMQKTGNYPIQVNKDAVVASKYYFDTRLGEAKQSHSLAAPFAIKQGYSLDRDTGEFLDASGSVVPKEEAVTSISMAG